MLSPVQTHDFTNPLAPNLTDRDLSSHLGPVASRGAGGLNVGFYYARVQLTSRRAAFNGRFETRLFVAIQPKGDRYSMAREPITDRDAQARFPAEYAAFKTYQDTPTRGTPLMELPGVSQSQIAILSINGIRSIEDLLSLTPDIVAQAGGMEATTAYKIAKRWADKTAAAGDDVSLARELAAMEVENKTYRDAMRGMEVQMAAMQAKIDALATMGAVVPAQVASGNIQPAAEPVSTGPLADIFGDSGSATGNDDLGGDINPLEE